MINFAKNLNSSVYFDFKIFKSFEKIFRKNKLLYLENEIVIKNIFIFLFEIYDDFFFEFFDFSKNYFFDKNKKIMNIKFPDFSIVLYYGLKPSFLNLLLKDEKLKKIIFEFFEKSKRIFKIIKKIPHICLLYVFDILKICCFLIRFKKIKKFVKIKKKILIMKYLEIILLFLKYQYYEDLEKNINFIFPIIENILKNFIFKNNPFENLFYDIHNIIDCEINIIDPKIKKFLKKKLTKKSFLKKIRK